MKNYLKFTNSSGQGGDNPGEQLLTIDELRMALSQLYQDDPEWRVQIATQSMAEQPLLTAFVLLNLPPESSDLVHLAATNICLALCAALKNRHGSLPKLEACELKAAWDAAARSGPDPKPQDSARYREIRMFVREHLDELKQHCGNGLADNACQALERVLLVTVRLLDARILARNSAPNNGQDATPKPDQVVDTDYERFDHWLLPSEFLADHAMILESMEGVGAITGEMQEQLKLEQPQLWAFLEECHALCKQHGRQPMPIVMGSFAWKAVSDAFGAVPSASVEDLWQATSSPEVGLQQARSIKPKGRTEAERMKALAAWLWQVAMERKGMEDEALGQLAFQISMGAMNNAVMRYGI